MVVLWLRAVGDDDDVEVAMAAALETYLPPSGELFWAGLVEQLGRRLVGMCTELSKLER